MADTAPSLEISQSTPRMSFLSRVMGVFIEPGETFEDIARKPDWIAPLVLLLLVTVATVTTMMVKIGAARLVLNNLQQTGRAKGMDPAQLSVVVQKSAGIMGVVMPVSAIIGLALFMLVVAGLGLLFLNGFFGQHARFKEVFSVACYAYLPSILGAVMAIAVMLFGDPAAFNFQSPAPTNPGFFMDPLASSRAVLAVATSLDVIIIWFLVLLAIGLSRVVQKKIKTGTIFMTYLGVWVLWVVAKVGMALLFSAR